MKANFPGSVFLRTLSKFEKRKNERLVFVSACPPKSRSRGSRAVDVKEVYYESEERAVLLFCSHNKSFF